MTLLPLLENLPSSLSPLAACAGHASNLTFPFQELAKKSGQAALSSTLNKPSAREPITPSLSPSGAVWVPSALPFPQALEEGAVALMGTLGAQFSREYRSFIDHCCLETLLLPGLWVCAGHGAQRYLCMSYKGLFPFYQ